MKQLGLFVLFVSVTLFNVAYGAPASFERAKVEARQYVYHDRNQAEQGTLYCGCRWEWAGRSGGRVDMAPAAMRSAPSPLGPNARNGSISSRQQLWPGTPMLAAGGMPKLRQGRTAECGGVCQ